MVQVYRALQRDQNLQEVQVIREDHGLAYSVYTFHGGYSDTGLFGIYAATSPETAARVLELIGQECRKVRREGVTADELARTKQPVLFWTGASCGGVTSDAHD